MNSMPLVTHMKDCSRKVCPTHNKWSCEMEIEIMRTYCVNLCKIIHNQDGDTLLMLNIQRSKWSNIWHKKKLVDGRNAIDNKVYWSAIKLRNINGGVGQILHHREVQRSKDFDITISTHKIGTQRTDLASEQFCSILEVYWLHIPSPGQISLF